MKNLFLRILSVVLFSLWTLAAYGQCEAKIKDFYLMYMQNAESNEAANVGLLKAHLSPELIAKLNEYAQQSDTDAVIHAQDVCDYAMQSLAVEPMKEDWYMVKYKWSPTDDYTCIPVKATDTDGKFIIHDISPMK